MDCLYGMLVPVASRFTTGEMGVTGMGSVKVEGSDVEGNVFGAAPLQDESVA